MATMQKITSNLWFDNQAEDAAKFYTSIFRNSKISRIAYYPNVGQDIHKMPAGSVMTVEFYIEGQEFVALNGGPVFKFNESISFIVNCTTQQELDHYWDALKEGGDPASQQCGWLKDKFGVSWQIVPTQLNDLITSPDKAKAARTFEAMLHMKKLDMPKLQAAFDGK